MDCYCPKEIIKQVSAIVQAAGVSADDAGILAASLVEADLSGTATHGISRLAIYIKRIQKGLIDPKAKLRGFRPKAGEAYGRIEGPKGELGFYLISDGSPNPYRYRVRPPSLINLTVLEDMCLGSNVADVVLIFGSVDIVLGEVDR